MKKKFDTNTITLKMIIEYDKDGNFRLVAPDGTKSDWTLYNHLTVLKWNGKDYIAASPYGLLDSVGKEDSDVLCEVKPINAVVKKVKGSRPDETINTRRKKTGKKARAKKSPVK